MGVVVVGNVGIDTNVYLYGKEIDFSVEANFSENIDYVGQAGGYAARGYAQLGSKTAFIGHVGDDAAGHMVREAFARDQIDCTGLLVDPSGTARSVNIMYKDGRRKNFYDGKGHMDLSPPIEIAKKLFAGAKLAHFNIPNWARHLLPLATTAGVTIACDIQDVVDPEDPYRREFADLADILFFSATNHEDPTPLMRLFLNNKPGRIVVSGLGAKGAAVGSEDGIRFLPPVSLDLPVVDTNGAGDGLAVGFLTSYVLEKRPLIESVNRGQIVARYTCAQRATTDTLIKQEMLERYQTTDERPETGDQR